MELKDLIGLHELSGVELYATPAHEEWYSSDDAETVSFVLDGKTYTAIQDAGDGYRSSMRDIAEDGFVVKNTFAPVKVMCSMREDQPGDYCRGNEVLDMMDVISGKIVLSVGTMNTDDYYPWWVGEWSPQHLAVNSSAAQKESQQ